MNSDAIIEALSIDCVIFGVQNGKLSVLTVQHRDGISKGLWALPGGWIRYDESVNDAAVRLLRDLTGLENIFLEQFQTFGARDRYPQSRVITIAYYALVRPDDYQLVPGFTASDAKWFQVGHVPSMPYDHDQILDHGFKALKFKIRHEPIGFSLLPAKFTLPQLQEVYEAILEVKLDRANFRRKIMKMNLLVECKEKEKNVAHRAANFYRFDQKVYDKLKRKGFVFEY